MDEKNSNSLHPIDALNYSKLLFFKPTNIPEMAMYKYIWRKNPSLPSLTDSEKMHYTVNGLKNAFANKGETLLGHKIVYPEDIHRAITYPTPLEFTDGTLVINEDYRHKWSDFYDELDDAALAFILRYLSKADDKQWFATISHSTAPQGYFVNGYTEFEPGSLQVKANQHNTITTEAFVFTNSEPRRWPRQHREELANEFASGQFKFYFMEGNCLKCWTYFAPSPPKITTVCNLHGYFKKKDVLYSKENLPIKILNNPGSLPVGAQSLYITQLQERLNELNNGDIPITGTFDEKTLAAVSAFKREYGLGDDNAVDQKTWRYLFPSINADINVLSYASNAETAFDMLKVRLKQLGYVVEGVDENNVNWKEALGAFNKEIGKIPVGDKPIITMEAWEILFSGWRPGTIFWPVPGYDQTKDVFSRWGVRFKSENIPHGTDFHHGIDIPTAATPKTDDPDYTDDYHIGKEVVAVADGICFGVVKNIKRGKNANDVFGNVVFIKHSINEFNWVTEYAHLSDVYVSDDEIVTAGQKIGKTGNTGHIISSSHGVHLHFGLFYSHNYGNRTTQNANPIPKYHPQDIRGGDHDNNNQLWTYSWEPHGDNPNSMFIIAQTNGKELFVPNPSFNADYNSIPEKFKKTRDNFQGITNNEKLEKLRKYLLSLLPE